MQYRASVATLCSHPRLTKRQRISMHRISDSFPMVILQSLMKTLFPTTMFCVLDFLANHLAYRESNLVRNASSPTEVLIHEPDRHAGTHRCRSEYCNTLMECFARYRENGNTYDPYDGRKFEIFIDRTKYDTVLAKSPEYIKNYRSEDLLATSFSMGHGRISVLWSYLR